MNEILNQFTGVKDVNNYIFGVISSVPAIGEYIVTTASGLSIAIYDTSETYEEGDQVILSTQKQELNSIFILRKVDKIFPQAVNIVIDNGVG